MARFLDLVREAFGARRVRLALGVGLAVLIVFAAAGWFVQRSRKARLAAQAPGTADTAAQPAGNAPGSETATEGKPGESHEGANHEVSAKPHAPGSGGAAVAPPLVPGPPRAGRPVPPISGRPPGGPAESPPPTAVPPSEDTRPAASTAARELVPQPSSGTPTVALVPASTQEPDPGSGRQPRSGAPDEARHAVPADSARSASDVRPGGERPEEPGAASRASAPAPAAPPTLEEQYKEVPKGLQPAFVLNGITYSVTQRKGRAFIDGKSFTVGDEYQGWKVMDVRERSVILVQGTLRFSLTRR
ncbi:MAG: hypothetical protein HYZ53_07750 [Planctomycetes bacterium]|nr:hypothetical protein [Planctomycetota bacterium]